MTAPNLGAAGSRGALAAAVHAVWERRRPEMLARVRSIEETVEALAAGHVPDHLRKRALADSHKLAGAAGTFGFHRSSDHARALEDALAASSGLRLEDAAWMAQSLLAMRAELEGATALHGKDEREDAPLVLIASDETRVSEDLGSELTARGFRIQRVALADASASVAVERPVAVLLDRGDDTSDDTAGLVGPLATAAAGAAVLVLADTPTLAGRVAVARAGARTVLARSLAPRRIADAVAQAAVQARSERPRVLALDDDGAILDALQLLLTRAGIAIEAVLSPDAFWESLRREPPDLVILDVDMPEVDGVALCRVIRNEPGLAELPVLFLSARVDAVTVERVFAAGADDYVGKPIVASVLLNRLRNRLDRTRLLRELAERDQLTGLTNRAKSELELERLLALAARSGEPLSVALVDIDRFKRINDGFGHAAGDLVLRGVADVLRASFRTDDVVGRWGGEEFVVGLYENSVARAAERVSAALARLREEGVPGAGEAGAGVTFSAGVAELGIHGHDVQAIYRSADEALYVAKATGRDRVVHAEAVTPGTMGPLGSLARPTASHSRCPGCGHS